MNSISSLINAYSSIQTISVCQFANLYFSWGSKCSWSNLDYCHCKCNSLHSSIILYILIDNIWPTQNPPEFIPVVSQDVTHYSVIVDMIITNHTMSVPASVACPTSTGVCSYTYSFRSLCLSNSPLSVSVSAVNVIGMGQTCTPQTGIGKHRLHKNCLCIMPCTYPVNVNTWTLRTAIH